MKIASLKERHPNETRVAITPDIVKLFVRSKFDVCIETKAGLTAGFSDEDYVAAGAKVSKVPLEVIGDADIILKVQPTPMDEKINELSFAKKGALVIGLLLNADKKLFDSYADKKINAMSLELMPRISKVQHMDVLSSQSNLAGYRAVIEAAYHCLGVFPMLMTAAGTILAKKTLVIGTGVAGLQAIATAKRLGGIVQAYDVRQATKEQVESLGAKFINTHLQDCETKSGYAKAKLDSASIKAQNEILTNAAKNNDIIITTAQIPGKKAPILISKEMIAQMKPGSIIIDLAAGTGGNTELTKADKTVDVHGVKIIGYTNFPGLVPHDASKLYAKNLYNVITYAFNDGILNANDDVIKSMLVTFEGKVVYGL